MIDYSAAKLDLLSIHQVGNKTNGEDLILSKHPIDEISSEADALLKKYFLNGFQTPEYFGFTFSNGDHNLNPLYRFADEVFEGHSNFHTVSVHIAKHLYEISNHPMIKQGELFVAYFSGMSIDYETVDAIGIFKSENKQNFLGLERNKSEFSIQQLKGIQVDKADKACLIFRRDRENGYKVCIFDKTNKSEEAQFWKEQFLGVQAKKDDFLQTKEFLNITKHFVSEQLKEDFEVNKSDQIDILNRSMEYFKKRDTFSKQEFEEEVLMDEAVIKSFQKFDTEYRKEHSVELNDSFEISLPAVKKQARVFKSILKLDRNFHIYIHGDKNKIEHGVEKDGRKFYKIYYENES